MRVKQLWNYVPLPAMLKLVYNRLTLSRITTAYFALALLHCVVQIGLQSHALEIEQTQSFVIHGIVHAGNVTEKFAAQDSDDHVELCRSIPGQTSDRQPCMTFYGVDGKHQQRIDGRSSQALLSRAPVFTGVVDDDGQIDRVTVNGLANLPSVTLSNSCTKVLAWPDQIISQAKREALAMIAFQVWLFGISIVAILNESTPHVLAALATHVLSTGWASFQIERSVNFKGRFTDIVTNAACGGIDLMPTYWRTKFNNQIPILALNVVSLLVSCFLSWKLYKQYGVQSLKRVGASPRMHRIYILVLVLSVSLQLTAFFLVTALALWIEQLSRGPIALMAKHRHIYLGVFIGTISLILPWLYTGWTSVRRERRLTTHLFLFTSLLLLAAQTGMFISPIYRLTFHTWTFFAALTVAGFVLLVATFAMAIVCRGLFGRGLVHFLQVEDEEQGGDFVPVYFEGDDNGGLEKRRMSWESGDAGVVRQVELKAERESDGEYDKDFSSEKVRPPPRVRFPDEDVQGHKARVRFSDGTDGAERHSFVHDPSAAHNPSQHTRSNSSISSWYHYPRGKELITRGVNATPGARDGVGLPGSVRPMNKKRPPGLTITVPENTYAAGRI